MTTDDQVAARARERFAGLRAAALGRLGSGAGVPEAGTAPPPGWCISSVARLVTNAPPATVDAVTGLQRRLDRVGRWRHYPAQALHVSLLGCTRREPQPQTGQADRLDRVVDCVRQTLDGLDPAPVRLAGLNLVGAQAFVEVVPDGDAWARARQRLADALRAAGEQPMAHPDPEPMHLNVSRLLGLTDGSATTGLAALLADPSVGVHADVVLSVVEVVVTDFVLTPATTVTVAALTAGGPAR